MSLINEVLRDLEKRRHVPFSSENTQALFSNLKTTALQKMTQQHIVILFSTIIAVIVISIIIWMWPSKTIPLTEKPVRAAPRGHSIEKHSPVVAPTNSERPPVAPTSYSIGWARRGPSEVSAEPIESATAIETAVETAVEAETEPPVKQNARVEPTALRAKQQAKLLLQAGELVQALEILQEQVNPPLSEDFEYHALLAELYRRTEQPQMAIKIYQALLEQQPGEGSWWVGLGIALQNMGEFQAARTAYLKAQATETLELELQQYVNKQLSVLQG